jgi:hypothetical protein
MEDYETFMPSNSTSLSLLARRRAFQLYQPGFQFNHLAAGTYQLLKYSVTSITAHRGSGTGSLQK